MPRGRLRPRGNSLLPGADRMRSIPVRPKTRNAKHSESSGVLSLQKPGDRNKAGRSARVSGKDPSVSKTIAARLSDPRILQLF